MFKTIYLDSGATTRVDDAVVEEMLPFFTKKYGNASSAHTQGFSAKNSLSNARSTIAKAIHADEEEIIFTSGGTESNNLAIKGIAFAFKKGHIITTKVEHKCILNACKWLETQGFKVTYLPVDNKGFVSPEKLEKAIKKSTILVSILHANNEIGTIQNLKTLGKICKKHKVLFHSDACQSFTKVPIDVDKMHLDLLTINSHKIHGPKGAGALFIRKGVKITPLLHGGGQENNIRAGTENIPGIVGFAKAVSIAKEKDVRKMSILRDRLISELMKIEGAHLNGPTGNERLCNNINVHFDKIDGSALGGYLDRKFISTSTGSACSEASAEPSYVLRAIGLSKKQAGESIRITLSKYNTEEDINKTAEKITKIVNKLRKKTLLDKVLDKL